jgi:hypothetical protein
MIDGAGNIEAGETRRFLLARRRSGGLASHRLQPGESDHRAETLERGATGDDGIFAIHF